jgi:ABC-type dipeptide/oligopeptide/nickel transport system ATPase subunit
VSAAFVMFIKPADNENAYPPILVDGLTKTYRRNRRSFPWSKTVAIPVLRDVNLSLQRGQILGMCGPSGSGKSTLARCMACLESWDSGEVIVAGHRIAKAHGQVHREARRRVQLVFQDSAASLNPSFSALETVREPLDILRKGTAEERREASMFAMQRVGLGYIPTTRSVNDLSGGERRRLALARALTIQPAVLVLDETLSGVDVGIQAEIVNLLLDLQAEFSMSYVFITHNVRLAFHLADEIVLMEAGQITKRGRAEELFEVHRTRS